MNAVKIRGLEVWACHGVHADEKKQKQKFIFDCELETDFYHGAKKDDLAGTLNYSAVCDLLVETARSNTFNLIETLAYTGVYAIFKAFDTQKITLSVYKPQAPVKHPFNTVGVTVGVECETVYLSLGSSQGDKKAYLDNAIKALKKTDGIKVKKVSSYIETEPYGGVAENGFLNCAVEIQTILTPKQLLEEIHRIEAENGRRREVRWGDRTLDIDIVFFGNKIIDEPDLVVPHADYLNRNFVLEPLKEIAPNFVCPDSSKKVKDLPLL
ncbi:MAG: 2-amino-4-hydroxy-6-hydroxymethyldihydropteridine diphosphokinase [Clostridia bacterium]|nr:2-amino-4-hydroxy-6-hydroxymethyldihydropteridine diphosphokinase [Clostridia bacterium]